MKAAGGFTGSSFKIRSTPTSFGGMGESSPVGYITAKSPKQVGYASISRNYIVHVAAHPLTTQHATIARENPRRYVGQTKRERPSALALAFRTLTGSSGQYRGSTGTRSSACLLLGCFLLLLCLNTLDVRFDVFNR